MKILKKAGATIIMSFALAMASPVILPVTGISIAKAAEINLSEKDATIKAGDSKTLKLTGITAEDKIQWASSEPSIAVVSKKGKVTGKKPGTAVITATVNKKKYNCSVTVKKSAEKKVELGDLSFSMPANREWVVLDTSNEDALQFISMDFLAENFELILLVAEKTGLEEDIIRWDEYSEENLSLFSSVYSEELTKVLQEELGTMADITLGKTDFYRTKSGGVIELAFTLSIADADMTMAAKMYVVILDNYTLMEIVVTEEEKIPASTDKMMKSIIDTIKIK